MLKWFSKNRKNKFPKGSPHPISVSIVKGNFVAVVLKTPWGRGQLEPRGITGPVSELLEQGERLFLFDLGNTYGVASGVVGEIINSMECVLSRGGRVVLAICNSLWEQMIQVGLEEKFPVEMEFQAALEWLVGPENESTNIVRCRKILPLNMNCREPSDSLFELADERFQLISGGAISPLMTGYHYMLAELSLAEFLSERSIDRVEILPAVILRRSTKEEFNTHCRLIVNGSFDPDQIGDVPTGGDRLVVLSGTSSLFVSPSLKTSLESAGFDYLKFSEGLRLFF